MMETIDFTPDISRDPDGSRTRELLAAHMAYVRWHAIRSWCVWIAAASAVLETVASFCQLPVLHNFLLRVCATALLAAIASWREENRVRRQRNSLVKVLGATVRLSL